MLCDFNQTSKKWICKNCGRQANINPNKKFMPTAKCRIPENYRFRSGYIHNKKIKGVGDTLSEIIKKIGYGYETISKARAKITYLNKKGIDWCDKNQHIILLWLKEECISNKVQFLDLIGKAIIKLAVRKAKNQDLLI